MTFKEFIVNMFQDVNGDISSKRVSLFILLILFVVYVVLTSLDIFSFNDKILGAMMYLLLAFGGFVGAEQYISSVTGFLNQRFTKDKDNVQRQ